MPWGCDVDSVENAAALQAWLSESGLPPQKMGIQKVEVGERGLVALKNIRKGEKLLFVPPSLFITAESVSLIGLSLCLSVSFSFSFSFLVGIFVSCLYDSENVFLLCLVGVEFIDCLDIGCIL